MEIRSLPTGADCRARPVQVLAYIPQKLLQVLTFETFKKVGGLRNDGIDDGKRKELPLDLSNGLKKRHHEKASAAFWSKRQSETFLQTNPKQNEQYKPHEQHKLRSSTTEFSGTSIRAMKIFRLRSSNFGLRSSVY